MSRPLAACRAGRGGGCGACHQPLIVPGAWPGWQVWECGAGIGAAASVVDVLGEAGIGVAELVGSGSPGVRLSPADSEASPGPHRSPSRTGGPDTPANDQPRQTNTLDVQPLTPQLRGGSGLAGEQRVDPAAVAREHAAPPPQEPERPTVRCRRRPVRHSGIRPPVAMAHRHVPCAGRSTRKPRPIADPVAAIASLVTERGPGEPAGVRLTSGRR